MLLENVWDYHFDPQTNVIDVHISRLRSKSTKFGNTLLRTVRGAGIHYVKVNRLISTSTCSAAIIYMVLFATSMFIRLASSTGATHGIHVRPGRMKPLRLKCWGWQSSTAEPG